MSPANQWGWAEVLANKTNYLLEILIWQNANMGKKKSKQTKKPEPFIPDFMDKPKKGGISEGVEAHSVDQIKAMLDGRRS